MLGKSAFSATIALLLVNCLTGCGPNYSPNTYSSNAVQQANKVDQGVIVGVRAVMISADATLGTGTGGAAGGIAGSQVGTGAVSALSALGGSLAGATIGNMVTHGASDTNGFEYIVRKPSGDLLSVTQKDAVALQIGQHVLIIEGPQARIVPDYTVKLEDGQHREIAASAAKPVPDVAAVPVGTPTASAPPVVEPTAAAPAPAVPTITSTPLPPPPVQPEPKAIPEGAAGGSAEPPPKSAANGG